jgi:ribonuclease Z
MFEIVFLGTSASAPSVYRGLSSAAILAGEDRFLVDAGEGTQRQILRSGIGISTALVMFPLAAAVTIS